MRILALTIWIGIASQNAWGAVDVEKIFRLAEEKAAIQEAAQPEQKAFPSESKGGLWKSTIPENWESGFYPGILWLIYEHALQEGRPDADAWRAKAEAWTAGLKNQQWNTKTHDVGFMVGTSYGTGYRLTENPEYREILLNAARSLSTRFLKAPGVLRAWGNLADWSKCTVVVDSTMNLDLLLWAAKNGGTAYNGTGEDLETMVARHATQIRRWLVRPDGSTRHLAEFDPESGEVLRLGTNQGMSEDSTWSRGQAWAMLGFTRLYEETGCRAYLRTARKTADYMLEHLPKDGIPAADLDGPQSLEFKDSSAAAISAAALLRLSQNCRGRAGRKYEEKGVRLLEALTQAPYLSEDPGTSALLLHGARAYHTDPEDKGTNLSLIFGDYYLLEALLIYKEIQGKKQMPRVSSGHPAEKDQDN